MTPDDFRRLALELPGAEEGSHMGATDFRVGGRIFATLAMAGQGYGNLMLSPTLQQELIAGAPELFLPVHGGWGRMGATHIRLARTTEADVADALHVAWKHRVDRNAATGKKPAKKKSSALGFVVKKATTNPTTIKKSAAKKTASAKRRTPKT